MRLAIELSTEESEKLSKNSCILLIGHNVRNHWLPAKISILSSIALNKRNLVLFCFVLFCLHTNVPIRKTMLLSVPCDRSDHVTNLGCWYVGRRSWAGLPLKLLSKGGPSNQHCTKVLARATRQES